MSLKYEPASVAQHISGGVLHTFDVDLSVVSVRACKVTHHAQLNVSVQLRTLTVELSEESVPGPEPSALRFFTQPSSMKEIFFFITLNPRVE